MLPQTASTAPALGRYRIVGELGRGAMGVVYRAVDPLLDRTVAIKTVNLAEALDEATEYDARFQQEAKAAGRLAHANLITIHDVGREGDIAFMAMEFLEGQELRSLIAQRGRLSVAEAVRIAAQVADGLAYAHEHGVTHRDIKPGNIMILRSGLAKIMDFGIARMRSSDVRTKTGILLGSPKYMSPEQVLGQDVDGRSDIFSLGVVLHEMLTGATPFSGETVTGLMHQIATAPATPPSRANAEVPQMLDFIVAKALAKKATERYQSAAELAADLRECATHLSPSSLPKAKESDTTYEKTVLLDREIERTRLLSSHFDSMEATRKLAAATETLCLEASPQSSPQPVGPELRPTGDARPNHDPEWTRQERLVLAAGVTVGAIIAAVIALA